MATTVNCAFIDFNATIVNLDPGRRDLAISSRNWLWEQLNKLDQIENSTFPLKYEEKHIKYGSFARKTKIRELDDVDLMFCLTANGATYLKEGDKYTIHTTSAGSRLKDLSDSNILNSRKVVNKLKSSLYNIDQYSSAEINRRGEATTLRLKSYEWVFDIVPSFYTDTNLYLIPDGNGNWKSTDPRVDKQVITDVNQKYEGKALQLIRTLKYWNIHNSSCTISSYLFEQIVVNYIYSRNILAQWIDYDIKDFFYYLSNNIYHSVNDPKNLQGDLNKLTFEQRASISNKSKWAYSKAEQAINAETQKSNVEESINIWREIFGSKFPRYA